MRLDGGAPIRGVPLYLSGISIQKQDFGEENSPNYLGLLNAMLRKIILVDYSSRTISVESPSIEFDGATDASDNFWDSMDIQPSETNKQIYPMDVFLILYLSADPLFQRKILQKLFKCNYHYL